LVCKGDRGRVAGGRDGNNIVAACETRLNRIDRGDRGVRPHRVFTMSADRMWAKNGNGDIDSAGRWRITDPPIPGFGKMGRFIPAVFLYPYHRVLGQVG
jgi:hypothetical protein